MKHAVAAVTCAAALVAALTACGGADNKSAPPSTTGGSSPSGTAVSPPATGPAKPLPSGTAIGPVALAASSTFTYGGLKVVVNLPADIPTESQPSTRLTSEFFQAVGRTMARNKLDPSLSGLASDEVVKYIQTAVVPGSVRGIGSVIFTISKIHTVAGRTQATVCVDQLNLVQVRKDGSRFLDTDANGKRSPRVRMTAELNRGITGTRMTRLTSAVGSC